VKILAILTRFWNLLYDISLQFRTALRLYHWVIDVQVMTNKIKSCLPWQAMVRDQIIEVKEHNYLSILVACKSLPEVKDFFALLERLCMLYLKFSYA